MNSIKFIPLVLSFFIIEFAHSQSAKETARAVPDTWTVHNREVSFDDGTIHLNAQAGDGILWLKNSDFKNGTIELDIRGKDTPGQSFVGLAFHGKDDETFDAIYFRPFNFLNPERNSHSVQYISMPEHDWSALRNAFPGKYEDTISPVPDPVDGWFHAKVVVGYPVVKVYVNGSADPTLEIKQISDLRHGKIGLWVGNDSEGWFKNVVVVHKE